MKKIKLSLTDDHTPNTIDVEIVGLREEIIRVAGNGGTEIDLSDYDKSNEVDSKIITALENISVLHAPEVFTVPAPATTIFPLDKAPEFISEVLILDGDNVLYYLQATDYSVSGKNITINNPTLNTGNRVKIIYTYKYGS